MRPIVIMTDAPESGTRLARNVGGETVVWDLYETAPTVTDARLIIADLHSPDSSSIDRLKRALTKVRQPDTALLYLIHGNLERGKIQATMLGATRTLPASMAASLLTKTVAILSPSTAVAEQPAPRAQVQMAHRAFASIFLPKTPEMEAVEAGTELVERAIQDMKVREWLALVAEFDDVTHRHCMTVAGLAAAFAQSLGLNAADSHVVTKGALLHDIGKAKVPATILNKPGPLDASEWREMCQHPTYGFELLNEGNFSKKTLAVVRSHHEMLDGSGYPDGLKGSQISDLVRLITVCDIFAALIERRPYKEPKCAKVAYGILSEMKDKLDQDLVRVFAPVAFATEE